MPGGSHGRKRPENKHRKSLGDQLEDPQAHGVRVYPHKHKKRQRPDDEVGEGEEELLPGKLSSKILREARAQQEEEEREGTAAEAAAGTSGRLQHSRLGRGAAAAAASDDSDIDEYDYDGLSEAGPSEWGGGEVEISAEDEDALAAFMAPHAEAQQQRTLADVILDKIRQRQSGSGGIDDLDDPEAAGMVPQGIDPKVEEVYRGVGKLLSRYTAGKIPKAFKIIPNLRNWEEVLFLTDVEHWSPHAVYQATRLFISNLNAKMAQRYLALVLLPHVRQDVRENRRLHFALYQAVKKAAYKPDAFYKGLLLPLCASGTCSLREAVIMSSVLKRVSIPVLHSAAALLRVAEMNYSGINSFFIMELLNKKYALPYRVIDALVDHFAMFEREERLLPVIWHQSLLTFVQRYKSEIRAEDKEVLKRVMRVQHHHKVTPEVHRELEGSRNRGEKGSGPGAMAGQSRVASHVTENPRDLPPVMMEED